MFSCFAPATGKTIGCLAEPRKVTDPKVRAAADVSVTRDAKKKQNKRATRSLRVILVVAILPVGLL